MPRDNDDEQPLPRSSIARLELLLAKLEPVVGRLGANLEELTREVREGRAETERRLRVLEDEKTRNELFRADFKENAAPKIGVLHDEWQQRSGGRHTNISNREWLLALLTLVLAVINIAQFLSRSS